MSVSLSVVHNDVIREAQKFIFVVLEIFWYTFLLIDMTKKCVL